MARIRHALTDTDVAQLAPQTSGGERTFRQFGVPGLMLKIGKYKRSWELRIERTPPVRRPLGEWPKVKVAAAQDTARAMWERHRAGQPVDGPPRGEETIVSTWPLFRARLVDEARSSKTLAAYQHAYDRLSEAVRQRPLRDLIADPTIMADEQQRIRKRLANRKRGGLSAAIASAVFVSALFGFARGRDPTLLGNPTSGCLTTTPKRHDLPILEATEMPAWWAQVQKLKNSIVHEALLFTLLSGLRRESLESLKWADLDLRRGCIRVNVAKGGHDRAFDLILSRPMVRCLWRVRSAGRVLFPDAAQTWVFPSENGSHLTGNSLTKYGVVANHGLRRSYATCAALAGVDEPTIGRLLIIAAGV